MQDYRDPLSNLFCVTFDNSSVKAKFYSSIQYLNETLNKLIFEKYIDDQFKPLSAESITNQTYIADKFFYEAGEILRVNYYTFVNGTNILDDKFYLYKSSAFGECVKTEPLRFLKDIPKSSCGFKMVKFILK